MSLRIVIASLFVAGTAYAQAPGEMQVQPVAVQPVTVVAAGPCGDCVPVMSNRWSVGLSIGSMGLAADSTPDATTSFAIGELAVRFRATPHLELELAVGGGRQHDNGVDGDLEVNTAAFALRYRFMPYRKWNLYAMVGIGGASVVSHEASEQERHDATRGMFEVGVGIERRFEHFALSAELRGVSLAEPKSDDAQPVMTDASTTTPPAMTSTDKMSGGQFTIGASYYF